MFLRQAGDAVVGAWVGEMIPYRLGWGLGEQSNNFFSFFQTTKRDLGVFVSLLFLFLSFFFCFVVDHYTRRSSLGVVLRTYT